ncbi:hypothetical protein MSG28_011992 [Choristoneura fumiferana]|uniref:Uncharacterized protein n=1 Tax=Choristoneura fumiferana TaxID=7141 RepID=A0ACC0KMT4_CHOFU|nr:hypothetical protein MSG28_011992 [Choristoneura fumiferana]
MAKLQAHVHKQSASRAALGSPAALLMAKVNSSSSSSSGSSADFRVIPWSERSRLQFDRSLDQDYVLRLPVLDLSRIPQSRIMNPAPVHTVNLEAVINNPRPPADNNEFDYN